VWPRLCCCWMQSFRWLWGCAGTCVHAHTTGSCVYKKREYPSKQQTPNVLIEAFSMPLNGAGVQVSACNRSQLLCTCVLLVSLARFLFYVCYIMGLWLRDDENIRHMKNMIILICLPTSRRANTHITWCTIFLQIENNKSVPQSDVRYSAHFCSSRSRSFVCWRWWWSGVAVCLCFWSERAQSLQISCRDGETVEGLWTNSVFSLVISPVGLFGVGSQLIINSILCRLAGWPHKIRVSQSWQSKYSRSWTTTFWYLMRKNALTGSGTFHNNHHHQFMFLFVCACAKNPSTILFPLHRCRSHKTQRLVSR